MTDPVAAIAARVERHNAAAIAVRGAEAAASEEYQSPEDERRNRETYRDADRECTAAFDDFLRHAKADIRTLLTLLAASERRREDLLSDRVLEAVARGAMGRGSFGLEWDMATPESQRIYLRNARDYLTDALRATSTPGGPDA